MQLGWVDFSRTERDKVMGVMDLLKEPGVLDELGIGPIRDAFADYFFPGTSTVQTRAKYFVIVPYAMKHALSKTSGKDIRSTIEKLDEIEKECAETMLQSSDDGVIGSVVLAHNPDAWVKRPPSNIYWNGLKMLGVFKDKSLSIREYLSISIRDKKDKAGNDLGKQIDKQDLDEDDSDAGDSIIHDLWSLPEDYNRDSWLSGLNIELTAVEADFLYEKIVTNQRDTLFAWLLEHDSYDLTAYASFEALYQDIRDALPLKLREIMELANGFNRLVYMSRILYNVILSGEEVMTGQRNREAQQVWAKYKQNPAEYVSVNLETIFDEFNPNRNLRKFLNELQVALATEDIEKAKDIVIAREKSLKGASRAKLTSGGVYDPTKWACGGWLDYRFGSAKRIIMDIRKGEDRADV